MTMRGVNPGRYRHRIVVQEPAATQDPVTGEVIPTWATLFASVPCEITSEPGREFEEAKSRQAESVIQVALRAIPNFLPTWRITWRGFVYDVRSIQLDATGVREMLLTCRGLGEQVTGDLIDNGFALEEGGGLMLLEPGDFLLQE
jgi:head-tail adaptor